MEERATCPHSNALSGTSGSGIVAGQKKAADLTGLPVPIISKLVDGLMHMARTNIDKRSRLLSAAVELTYQNGFEATSLADIAREAKVPLGNVYYYFKTKDEIGEAIVELRLPRLSAQRSDGTKPDRPRIGFAPASKASSRTRIAWRSSAARSGRFAPSSTRRAARSPPERPRYSLNTWPGSRASFGRSGRGKTPTALPCTCFPPCKAFQSWLMPFMTPVLWRRRPSGSRVGFKACEAPGGLNPQAHRRSLKRAE